MIRGIVVRNKEFWISELIFFILTFIIFLPVVDKTKAMVMENTPVYEMVSESIKIYVTETIVGKGIAVFVLLGVLYYAVVRRIGILFVYSWINAAAFCGIAQSWLSYDYYFGASIMGALVVGIVLVAYAVVTIIFVLKIILKFLMKNLKIKVKKIKSGE